LSVTHRIDLKFDYLALLGQMPRERIRVLTIATLDYHSVLEDFAATAQPIGQVRNREAVLADQAT
jgi:hypothetical protein